MPVLVGGFARTVEGMQRGKAKGRVEKLGDHRLRGYLGWLVLGKANEKSRPGMKSLLVVQET